MEVVDQLAPEPRISQSEEEPMNFLESFAAEWYGDKGYFVRSNTVEYENRRRSIALGGALGYLG